MSGNRIALALINNAPTPYRVFFHERLARELTGVDCWSLFTHGVSNSNWQLELPESIRPVLFGEGQDSSQADQWQAQHREWWKAGRVIQWLRDQCIAAVILGGYNDLGRLRILHWCYAQGVPCFLFADSNIHADQGTGARQWVKQQALSRILGRFSGVLCCGSAGEAYFLKYGVPAERLFRAPYDADYNAIRNFSAQKAHGTAQRFGLVPGRRYLMFSGRLAPEKRVDLLVRAFLQVAPEFPDWDLLIVGSGPEQPALMELVGGLPGRILWTGFVNGFNDLAGLYAHASVAVLPSDVEPWGVAVTEAASRMPVIASSVVGAALDLVQDGENGRLFRVGNLDSLTSCLRDVLSPARLESMTGAAPRLFDAWRATNDPVQGVRRALGFVGINTP
jgi:glycosyltransferase involved in cell wall biosynthesis